MSFFTQDPLQSFLGKTTPNPGLPQPIKEEEKQAAKGKFHSFFDENVLAP
jgi:hypothetical protein